MKPAERSRSDAPNVTRCGVCDEPAGRHSHLHHAMEAERTAADYTSCGCVYAGQVGPCVRGRGHIGPCTVEDPTTHEGFVIYLCRNDDNDPHEGLAAA